MEDINLLDPVETAEDVVITDLFVNDNDLGTDESIFAPSLTYRVEGGRILGKIDELEAVQQAVSKILMTERFVFEIYSDQYGNDLNDLIGKDMPYVKTALENIIVEAFYSDDRIDDVTISEITQVNKQTLQVSFSINSLFGHFEAKTEVNV